MDLRGVARPEQAQSGARGVEPQLRRPLLEGSAACQATRHWRGRVGKACDRVEDTAHLQCGGTRVNGRSPMLAHSGQVQGRAQPGGCGPS